MIYFSSIIRHLLTAAAGGLIASGKLDPEQADTLIGAGGIIASIAWSAAAKSKYFPRIK